VISEPEVPTQTPTQTTANNNSTIANTYADTANNNSTITDTYTDTGSNADAKCNSVGSWRRWRRPPGWWRRRCLILQLHRHQHRHPNLLLLPLKKPEPTEIEEPEPEIPGTVGIHYSYLTGLSGQNVQTRKEYYKS